MQTTTVSHPYLTTLQQFRQLVYEQVFTARRDALFDTLDALLSGNTFASFPYLSQSERFRRKWHSLYAALQDGQIDTEALRHLLVSQLPQQGVCVFALDSSCWPRPRSRVLADLQYVHQPSSAVNGGNITIGYAYSFLEWCAKPPTSWSLPVDMRRIPSDQTAQQVGAEQVQALAQARAGCGQVLDIVVADGKYGNGRFLSAVSGSGMGIVTRLRCDRVFYRAPQAGEGKRGRPRQYGERFAFKEEQTWGEPDEVCAFEDGRYGQVCLQRWNGLRDRRAAGLTYDLIRAQVHLEKEKPPVAMWLCWVCAGDTPLVSVLTLWEAYVARWTIESGLRFRKERLGWTLPRFQDAEVGDRWTWLVGLAHWLLFLALGVVADCPLPWQKHQVAMTPYRVLQGFGRLFVQIGTPARGCQPRGKPCGWVKGRLRRRKDRHRVVKKGVIRSGSP